jgi:hypothetical protein
VKKEFLHKGFALGDEIFVYTFLWGKEMNHGDLSHCLKFVDVNAQIS